MQCFPSCRVLEKLSIDVLCWQLNVTDDRTPDKAIFHGHHMWVPSLIRDLDIVQTDVQELVDRLEDARDGQVVLELDSNLLVR